MPTPVLQKLNPFTAMPASGVAGSIRISDIQLGLVYDGINMKLPSGLVAANIDQVLLKLDHETIWQVSGALLNYINTWMGYNVNASYLPLWFIDRTALTIGGSRLGALDTKNIERQNLSLQLDINSSHTVTGGNIVEAVGIIGEDKPKYILGGKEFDSMHMFRALIQSTLDPASANQHSFNIGLGAAGANLLRALHFKHANLTHWGIKKDNETVSDVLPLADHDYIQDEILRNNQAGYFTWDALKHGNQMDAFSTMSKDGKRAANMQWLGTTSAADNITCIADVFAANVNAL